MNGCVVCGDREYMQVSLKGCCSSECARTLMLIHALAGLEVTLLGLVTATNSDFALPRENAYDETVESWLNP